MLKFVKYHKLCLKYHPDKNTDSDPNKFIELQEAYNTIIEYRKNRIFKEKKSKYSRNI